MSVFQDINLEVVNKYKVGVNPPPGFKRFYVGRGSPLGNPFTVEEYGRGNAIGKYKEYLMIQIGNKNPTIINELNRIYQASRTMPVELMCYCHPRPCHANVIRIAIMVTVGEMRNKKLPNGRPTCRCKKGKSSVWDNACSNCRTPHEQALMRKFNDDRSQYWK